MARHPLEVLQAFDLVDSIGLKAVMAQERSYECVHIGCHDVQLSKLLPGLAMETSVKPPRTGHIGNWNDILAGLAGPLDFNHSICHGSYGYPLIYCFTQTEAKINGQRQGDLVYCPGSVIENGKKRHLPLFTFDSCDFVARDRDTSWFCPFVMTEKDGTRVPLIEFHTRRLTELTGVMPRLEAQCIIENSEIVKMLLTVLLEAAAHRDNSRRAFQDIFSHTVTIGGRMERANIHKDGHGYWLEDQHYGTTKALVDAAIIPFLAVTDPTNTLTNIKSFPKRLPLMSHLLVSIVTAILGTHDPDKTMSKLPFNAHLHWGARDMAGYPPVRHGYLVQRSTIRSMRILCDTIRANFHAISPLVILLLPASMFMLCPLRAFPKDSECISILFKYVGKNHGPDSIRDIVRKWLKTHREQLSDYFLARFKPHSGVPNETVRPQFGGTVEPYGFLELTTRQACTIVGAMMEAVCN
jgi:hypothetical protein